MTKKFVSMFLAVAMCLSLAALPAYAKEDPISVSAETAFPNSATVMPRSIITQKVNQLLSNPNYGKAISYSSNWYSGLETVEILARLIYGENTYYEEDQNAIGYCLMNRLLDGGSGNNLRSIATASGQFASITSDARDTYLARNPDTSSEGWAHATYVAVAAEYALGSMSNFEAYVERPTGITDQLFFNSKPTFVSCSSNGNGCILYMGYRTENVAIPGVGSGYTNLSTLESAYDNLGERCNIYFNY